MRPKGGRFQAPGDLRLFPRAILAGAVVWLPGVFVLPGAVMPQGSIPVVWFYGARIMRAAIGLASAIIVPLFAESGPVNPEAIPAWGLAGAIVAFLSGLLWTFRKAVAMAKSGAEVLYSEVIQPTAEAHVKLVNTMRETRETDSKSIAVLAAKTTEIHQDLIRMRESEA